jgi:hypothetical protein
MALAPARDNSRGDGAGGGGDAGGLRIAGLAGAADAPVATPDDNGHDHDDGNGHDDDDGDGNGNDE